MSYYKKISAIDFSSTIKDIIDKYGAEASTALYDAIKETGERAAKKLQEVDTFAPHRTPTGEYSKDWDSKINRGARNTIYGTVYNIDKYRLTHLLEKGHVSRNGTGRTFGRVPAYPHIAPVNDWAQDEVVKQVIGRLEG